MPKKIIKIAQNIKKEQNQPVIVLANPQLGYNIGAVARVMANFDLYKLRLVKPRDGWLADETYSSASGASGIIDHSGVFKDVGEAISDLDYVFATTARRRDLIKEIMSPKSAAKDMKMRIAEGQKIGLLFGGEKSGLTNDELSYANTIITAPVNPGFASLNLAQAVCIVVYEFYSGISNGELGRVTDSDMGRTEGLSVDGTRAANKHEYMHFIGFLERVLEEKGFFYPDEKKNMMLNNIKSMFQRQNLTQKDIKILFGIFKHIIGE